MSRRVRSIHREQSAFLLAEEAVELLRRSGAATLSLYLIGTLPFLMAFLAYWSAMASSAYAYRYASSGALVLALLFIFMKTLHARFAQHLRARLQDSPLPAWTTGEFLRTFCRQGAVHATVVLVYPVCFVTVLPMAYAVGWYQNLTVLEDGGRRGTTTLMREAAAQAKLWPKQNHLLLWMASPLLVVLASAVYLATFPILDGLQVEGLDGPLVLALGFVYGGIVLLATLPLSPFACFVALNIGTAIFFGIEFFHVLTGADTVYTRNPAALMENSLFVALACGLTYTVLDPILKAAYTIRCHNGQSLRSGVDIRVALGRLRRAVPATAAAALVLAIAAAFFFHAPVHAQDSAGTAVSKLDRALDEEMAEAKYTWRMPREPQPPRELPWLLQGLTDLGEAIRDAVKWTLSFISDRWDDLMRWLRGDGEAFAAGWDTGFDPSIRLLITVLLVALAGIALYLLIQSYRSRSRAPEKSFAEEVQVPDLTDEATTAADMPEDEWYGLAQELANKGDYRLAARALFFSTLATLARQEIIRLARFKSNMDYQHEVMRKARVLQEDPANFTRSARIYESVWYGEHEANAETLDQMRAYRERLRHALQ